MSEPRRGWSTKGATMVVGAYASVFLVGMLYHLTAIGISVAESETSQDAADAAAYTASVVNARSMNAIGVMNQTQMAGTAASISVANLDYVLSICLAVPNPSLYPWSLCQAPYAQIQETKNGSMRAVFRMMEQITDEAEALRDATPALAAQSARQQVERVHGSRVSVAIIQAPMPLSTGSPDVLCRKGYVYRESMNRMFLPQIIFQRYQSMFFVPIDRPYRGSLEEIVNDPRSSYGSCPPRQYDIGPQVMDPVNQSGLEAMQIRAIALRNDVGSSDASAGVDLPRIVLAEEEALDEGERTRSLRGVAIAQAEYYSDWVYAVRLRADRGTTMPEENAWNMHWRARLRRVWVPEGSVGEWVDGRAIPACSEACNGRACASRCGGLRYLAPIINGSVH